VLLREVDRRLNLIQRIDQVSQTFSKNQWRLRRCHACSGEKQACFKWLRYRTRRTWDRQRWVVGKAKYTDKGPNPRFVVTNLFPRSGIEDTTYHRPMAQGQRQPIEVNVLGTRCSVAFNPETFYRERYCMRGEMENRIICRRTRSCLTNRPGDGDFAFIAMEF